MIGYNTGLVIFFFFILSLICTILSTNMFSFIIEHCYSNGEKNTHQQVDLFIAYRKSNVLYSPSFLSLYLVSLLNFNFFQHKMCFLDKHFNPLMPTTPTLDINGLISRFKFFKLIEINREIDIFFSLLSLYFTFIFLQFCL